MHLRYSIVAPSYPNDLAVTRALGPPGPGPGPRGGEGGSQSIPLRDNGMLLEHVCLPGVTLCYGLASCSAINAGPCAYLVLHFVPGGCASEVYLGIPYFLRDLVR